MSHSADLNIKNVSLLRQLCISYNCKVFQRILPSTDKILHSSIYNFSFAVCSVFEGIRLVLLFHLTMTLACELGGLLGACAVSMISP